jgi:hypothetical protein
MRSTAQVAGKAQGEIECYKANAEIQGTVPGVHTQKLRGDGYAVVQLPHPKGAKGQRSSKQHVCKIHGQSPFRMFSQGIDVGQPIPP